MCWLALISSKSGTIEWIFLFVWLVMNLITTTTKIPLYPSKLMILNPFTDALKWCCCSFECMDNFEVHKWYLSVQSHLFRYRQLFSSGWTAWIADTVLHNLHENTMKSNRWVRASVYFYLNIQQVWHKKVTIGKLITFDLLITSDRYLKYINVVLLANIVVCITSEYFCFKRRKAVVNVLIACAIARFSRAKKPAKSLIVW